MRQTIIFTLLAIGVGLAFVFFVVPASVNFFFSLISSPLIVEENTLPPQVPVLKAPPEATSDSSLVISGFGEAESTVVLVVSGNETSRKEIGEDGDFTFKVDLMEGENTITTYAVNEQEKESSLSREYTVILDTEAPTLIIEVPENGASIELRENQLTAIRGVTEPRAKVYINERLTTANSDGVFSTTYNLQEDKNRIEIIVQDKAGNQVETEISVNFKF